MKCPPNRSAADQRHRDQQTEIAANLVLGFRDWLADAVQRSRATYPAVVSGIEAVVVDTRSLEAWLGMLDHGVTDLLRLAEPPLLALTIDPPRPLERRSGDRGRSHQPAVSQRRQLTLIRGGRADA